MIQLLFVGDGERDAATVPRIAETILETTLHVKTRRWARLHEKGYARKLRYALAEARDLSVDGLIATIDADKHPQGQRLKELRKAREADRQSSPKLPTALGEAVPHGEAWLLDGAAAIRQVLRLSTDTKIPTVRETNSPKKELDDLLAENPRSKDKRLQVLEDIAREVRPDRCAHARETGFRGFCKDVRDELGPLVSQASNQA